jgi:hypothetical protein
MLRYKALGSKRTCARSGASPSFLLAHQPMIAFALG